MVSNAKLDLPEPESPVMTTRQSRGISSAMFLRLCTRAPCTAIVVRGAAFGAPFSPFAPGPAPVRDAGEAAGAAFLPDRFAAVLEAILGFPRVKEGEFLHLGAALLGEADGPPRLAEEPLVGQVLARRRYAADVEVPLEVVLDLGAGARLADGAQVIEHRPEQRRRPLRHVAVDRLQR